MKLRFWQRKPKDEPDPETNLCPLFHGAGSYTICLLPKTPELVVTHCKIREHPCKQVAAAGYPADVKLRRGEKHWVPEAVA